MASHLIKFLRGWGPLIFHALCSYSFLIALVFALDVPWKSALIIGGVSTGTFLLVCVVFFVWLEWDISIWKKNFKDVSSSAIVTRTFKLALLPCLLVILYFYILREGEDDGEKILYASSRVQNEMVIHPCGSSYQRQNSGGKNRVWDAADLISQPSETEIYIVTNAVFGANQSVGNCAQTGAYCSTTNINPGKIKPEWLSGVSWSFSHDFARATSIWNPITCYKEPVCKPGVLYDNGIQTESCIGNRFCSIDGWCPPISLADFSTEPMFNTNKFSIFLDMRPNFPEFKGVSWTKGGKGGYSANYAEIYARYHSYNKSVDTCSYHKDNDPFCPRFLLEDIVTAAGENVTEIATFGGQFKVDIEWNCKFDWGADIYDCLPKFIFINRSTNKGKPKIRSLITSQSEDKRTVTYSLGINISFEHVGKGLQIRFLSTLLYAQFVYVSYEMIKGPFIGLLRCIFAFYLTLTAKSMKSDDDEKSKTTMERNNTTTTTTTL